VNLAARRTVKLLPAFLIWLIHKPCTIGISGGQVSSCQTTHTRAPPFGVGDTRAVLSHRIAKDAPDDPDILSLRHDCPTLAGVSGKWSLLDGMSMIATGSFLAEPARSRHLFTAFPPGIPCACSSPRSIVTWTPPAARPCVRANRSSCWPGGGWIAGCSRQGFLNPERETSLDDVLTPLELPTRRVQAEMGTCRAAEVIDLSVNGVRVTLMPHELSELSGAAVDAARRAGSSTSHPAGVNRL
jgi:hypothetical protein